MMFLVSCKTTEVDKTDYVALGFPQNFNVGYELEDYWFFRHNGQQSILNNITLYELSEDYIYPFEDELELNRYAYYSSFFSDEKYNKLYAKGLSAEFVYSVGIQFETEKLVYGVYQFVFYDKIIGGPPYNYIEIDIIESNGEYSFICNYRYDIQDFEDVKTKFFDLFYVIYHQKDFPYTVYYDNTYIYLMSKSPNFDDSYKEYFRDNNVHLFKD